MPTDAQNQIPIEEAGERLMELAEEVVAGTEKILNLNGQPFVVLIDARKLNFYHELEAERARLVLLADAEAGLKDALAGRIISGPVCRKKPSV